MTLPPDHLDRSGYRLPTEAEWECACRAGTRSARPHGHSPEWIDAYEWFGKSAAGTTHPVGRKKPNDLGLFDMLGNLLEWCVDTKDNYPAPLAGAIPIDDSLVVPSWTDRYRLVLRGASINDTGWTPRSAFRLEGSPFVNIGIFGFRPVRTVVPEP